MRRGRRPGGHWRKRRCEACGRRLAVCSFPKALGPVCRRCLKTHPAANPKRPATADGYIDVRLGARVLRVSQHHGLVVLRIGRPIERPRSLALLPLSPALTIPPSAVPEVREALAQLKAVRPEP